MNAMVTKGHLRAVMSSWVMGKIILAQALSIGVLCAGCGSSNNGPGSVDAGPCNMLPTNTPFVAVQAKAVTAPQPQGGIIADGTYVLTDVTVYSAGVDGGGSGPTGEVDSEIIQVNGSTVQANQNGQANTSLISVAATTLSLMQTCPVTSMGGTLSVGYTASGGTFMLFPTATDGEPVGETFTKQ
jgi:hypothetical protein